MSATIGGPALPRRGAAPVGRRRSLPPLVVRGGEKAPPAFHAFVPPRVPPVLLLARIVAWIWAGFRFLAPIPLDRLRGVDSVERRAVRMRHVFERMGSTAIAAGKQIAMRLDVFPLEYATELSRMDDRAPPMPLTYVVQRVEAATGRALPEAFEVFDPEPIISDSIACVYQAVLRTGQKVAVKVRRPQAAMRFNAERLALGWLLRWLAPLVPFRAEFLVHIRNELPQLLLENLDFKRVARIQRIFRREAKRSKLDYVSAAKVFIGLCSDDVIFSEFVSGVWLDEVIAAHENRDDVALERLAAMGIDPAECGRRLLHVCWWGFFENLVFCELPEASRIVVQPDGRLVFVSLGDTGFLSYRQRRLLRTVLERLSEHDVEGAVTMLVQLLVPLPHIDVHEFTKRVEGRVWTQLFAIENRDRPWWERTSTAFWMALLRTTREYDVPVRIDVCRMIQSSCLYDQMAGRLWPRIRVFGEFRRYLARAQRRDARRALREQHRAMRAGQRGAAFTGIERMQRTLGQLNFWAESIVEALPVEYVSLTKKGAYSILQAFTTLSNVLKIALIAVVIRAAHVFRTTRTVDLSGATRWVVEHPLFLAVLLFLFLTTARRIMFRLEDTERDG